MSHQVATDKDWAVVLGIQNYPGFVGGQQQQLEGPVNDARAFKEWLIAEPPHGAGVPEAQVEDVIQEDLAPLSPPIDPGVVYGFWPGPSDCDEAFGKLELASSLSGGQRVGRRLYIYAAGHGFEPSLSIPGLVAGPAVMTANATFTEYRHVWVKQYADRCYMEKWFDEVLLFMDCCRDFYRSVPGRHWGDLNGLSGTNLGKHFYALGTKWNSQTREKEINGERRGIFSVALLRALQGEAIEPGTQSVTVGRLKSIVPQLMIEIAPEQFVPLQGSLPEFLPDAGDDLVVCESLPTLHPVTFRLGPQAIGRNILILGKDFTTIYDDVPQGDSFVLELPRALFFCRYTTVDNDKKTIKFEVKGTMCPIDL